MKKYVLISLFKNKSDQRKHARSKKSIITSIYAFMIIWSIKKNKLLIFSKFYFYFSAEILEREKNVYT